MVRPVMVHGTVRRFFFSPVNYDATYMPGQSRVTQFSRSSR